MFSICHRLRDIRNQNVHDLDLDLDLDIQTRLRSNIKMPNDSPNVTSKMVTMIGNEIVANQVKSQKFDIEAEDSRRNKMHLQQID